ncbi:hypothetical protein N752_13150 [Desulforamulus aquiferis]|nr:hypothetical protein N752_13150 [Desulforamulus aquiferis]
MILGWSGLSIHAQVASMIAKTDIRMGMFVVTRLAHALLASFFTWLFYKPVEASKEIALPALSPVVELLSHWTPVTVGYSLLAAFLLLLLLMIIALVYRLIRHIKRIIIN